MKSTKIVVFPFLWYFTPKRMEAWFERNAAKGWYPKINLFSFIFCVFKRGKTQRVQYFIDFQYREKKQYRIFHEELGWERVGRISNLILWRRITSDEEKDSYSMGSLAIYNKFSVFYWSFAIPFSLLTVFLFFSTINFIEYYLLNRIELALLTFASILLSYLFITRLIKIYHEKQVFKNLSENYSVKYKEGQNDNTDNLLYKK